MRHLHLFNAFGVELEYMITDAETLEVKPISDLVLTDEAGSLKGDVKRGDITWSNELVLHVLELKSSKPTADLVVLQNRFHGEVLRINSLLKKYNAILLPTAMHPFMNPKEQMRLWPHDYHEVYRAYNEMFNCQGHGWANVQSAHLNLPFHGNEEFDNLHSAIRIILPLLPALCASSPLVDGKYSGLLDSRLDYYKTNQASVPSFTGKVIPEIVNSHEHYKAEIFNVIQNDLQRLGQADVLDPIWVNSRGAIARFDRGSIEIRLMDVQESPYADVSVMAFVIETLKYIVLGDYLDPAYKTFSTDKLVSVLNETIAHGSEAVIQDKEFLSLFNVQSRLTARELWQIIFEQVSKEGKALSFFENTLKTIFSHGTLGERIKARLGENFDRDGILSLYKDLANCLQQNKIFSPA